MGGVILTGEASVTDFQIAVPGIWNDHRETEPVHS